MWPGVAVIIQMIRPNLIQDHAKNWKKINFKMNIFLSLNAEGLKFQDEFLWNNQNCIIDSSI
jgi:hypothetical protein